MFIVTEYAALMLSLVSLLYKDFENKHQVTQNKIIWIVLNMDLRVHVGSDVFKSLGWLPVSKRVDQIILKVKSGQSPDHMVKHFIPASSIHSYEIDLGKRGVFYSKSPKFLGEILWI